MKSPKEMLVLTTILSPLTLSLPLSLSPSCFVLSLSARCDLHSKFWWKLARRRKKLSERERERGRNNGANQPFPFFHLTFQGTCLMSRKNGNRDRMKWIERKRERKRENLSGAALLRPWHSFLWILTNTYFPTFPLLPLFLFFLFSLYYSFLSHPFPSLLDPFREFGWWWLPDGTEIQPPPVSHHRQSKDDVMREKKEKQEITGCQLTLRHILTLDSWRWERKKWKEEKEVRRKEVKVLSNIPVSTYNRSEGSWANNICSPRTTWGEKGKDELFLFLLYLFLSLSLWVCCLREREREREREKSTLNVADCNNNWCTSCWCYKWSKEQVILIIYRTLPLSLSLFLSLSLSLWEVKSHFCRFIFLLSAHQIPLDFSLRLLCFHRSRKSLFLPSLLTYLLTLPSICSFLSFHPSLSLDIDCMFNKWHCFPSFVLMQ